MALAWDRVQVVLGLEDFLAKAAACQPSGISSADAPAQGPSTLDASAAEEHPLHWRRCLWPAQEASVAYSTALAAATNCTILRPWGIGSAGGKAGTCS